MTSSVKIDYVDIIDKLRKELKETLNFVISEYNKGTQGDPFYAEVGSYMNGVEIYLDDEQSFVKHSAIKPNAIYSVVKFGSASTNFGSSICPISLLILGTENKVKPAQLFFSAFCSKWNLQGLKNDVSSTQIWLTPTVSSNYNEVNAAFRNLFTINGTLVIGQSTVRLGTIRYIYDNNGNYEDVDFISFNDSFSNSLSPQPFGNTCGFAVSEANFSTYSFSISTYLLNCHLVADCFAIKGFRNRKNGSYTSTKKPNDKFKIQLAFTNGYTNYWEGTESSDPNDEVKGKTLFQEFKCNSISMGEKIGDIPTITLGFTH